MANDTPEETVLVHLDKAERALKGAMLRLNLIGNGMVVHDINNALQGLEAVKLYIKNAEADCKGCPHRGS